MKWLLPVLLMIGCASPEVGPLDDIHAKEKKELVERCVKYYRKLTMERDPWMTVLPQDNYSWQISTCRKRIDKYLKNRWRNLDE